MYILELNNEHFFQEGEEMSFTDPGGTVIFEMKITEIALGHVKGKIMSEPNKGQSADLPLSVFRDLGYHAKVIEMSLDNPNFAFLMRKRRDEY